MKMPCLLDRLLDTYIQQARMFGSRKRHLAHFELTIPEQLYLDWHRCFVFHKLALDAIKTKKGSPVWLADQRISLPPLPIAREFCPSCSNHPLVRINL
jgi:hypothetical protein